MTYQETLNYLYSRLPMFQRVGSAAYKADLINTLKICSALNNPEKKFRSIHVAGTNGKGSTSHMLASVLQEAGYKTGLYTSPHLKDFRERIRINGKMIPRKKVTEFVLKNMEEFEKIKPSFFEWTVGLAFDYFAKSKVDIAVIETGLGGRLDSTNVIIPELSIITNISFDHKNLLGETLEEIANEKAGIIKTGIPVVLGEKQKETFHVFMKKASQENTKLILAENLVKSSKPNIEFKSIPQLSLFIKSRLFSGLIISPLAGIYQVRNIKTVIASSSVLKKNGFNISSANIKKGIWKVIRNTGLSGRWQQVSRKPLVIADTGHNTAGIKEVLKMIRLTPHQNLFMIIGMVSDKDCESILKLLPKKAFYYFTQPSIPRAMDAFDLEERASNYGLKGCTVPDVRKALRHAKKSAGKNDLIFAGGSTFVVAEVI